MATKKKQKDAQAGDAVAPAAAPKRKAPARKAAAPVVVEVEAAPVVVPQVEVAPAVVVPRPTRQQIAARAFWHFHQGSRDTLGNWLRAEREMADVVARGEPAPTDGWMRALAEG